MHNYTYLALGDSYTIGEQIPIDGSFPYQTVQQLRCKGLNIFAPEIVATTGFTTDELINLMNEKILLPAYDLVTLLIGVNNQYRGNSIIDFENDFEILLKKAIKFANKNPKKVFVLSIPDWGITPFAKNENSAKIELEINLYNNVCKRISKAYNCTFIDITTEYRNHKGDLSYLAKDELHPSAKEYSIWAKKLTIEIFNSIHI